MMFKDKYIHKFYAFALAAVFALTLAGCGGGGGTAAMPEPEPPAMPEPTPQETCEGEGGEWRNEACVSAEELAAEMTEAEALSAAQEGAMAAYMAAMAAVSGAKDPVAAANAQMYADAAMAASDAAAAATDSAMAMEHRAAAEAARDMAMEAGMTRGLGITTVANAAANQSRIDSAVLSGTPPPQAIPNAGRVGRAMAAAADEDATYTDSSHPTATDTTGGNADLNETTNQGNTPLTHLVRVTATHNGSGPRFTVHTSDTVNTGANDAAGINRLGRGEIPTALTMRGGWEGAELVASATGTAGNKEYAVVFTDINPPVQNYHSNAADSANYRTAVQLAADATTTETTGQSVNRAVISGEIPTDGSSFVGTYNQNPGDNNPPVSGRFTCPSGTPCSITVDSAGVLRAVSGYQFRPTDLNTITRNDVDYLAWGVWLHVPNAVPGTDPTTGAPAEGTPNDATVSAFASGSNRFAVNAALTGTATYNGVANGLYSAGGMVEHFEADASLTADFGGRSAGDSTPATVASDRGLLGGVSGSITNIKAGGMDVEGSISLGSAQLIAGDATTAADITTAADASTPATRFTGSTEGTLGGIRGLAGTWAGQFYGPNRAAGVGVRTEFPTGVAGTFGAVTTISPAVRILGSFGAWRAE